jgi:SNF2 family DNA or RNA helicase
MEQTKLQFLGQLYPFQQEVLKWSATIQKGIIGLDMGLGKTVITLAMICEKNCHRAIVVLPLQIVEQWKTSIVNFTNLEEKDVCIYQGRTRKSLELVDYRIVLTTYDAIRTDMVDPASKLYKYRYAFDMMVLDEAHKIRNKKTKSYATCYELGRHIQSKWLLSGTTIHNKFDDFYNLCEFLELPGLSIEMFGNAQKAAKWRSQYYFRLTKSQCDLGLPEKSIHEHYLNFDQKHLDDYEGIFAEVKDLYEDYSSNPTQLNFSSLLVKVLRLRQCCNHPDAALDEKHYLIPSNRHDEQSSAKFDKIFEIIANAPSNDKLIIFSQWEHSLGILGTRLRARGIPYLQYNGTLEIAERNQVVKDFRSTDKRVLLITLTSGGVGLDMSFANHVILLDSWWNQALEEQAIDRVYRIGQQKKVEVHRLYMQNTIEDWMVETKKEKLKVDTHFHKDNEVYLIDKHLLTEILHRYI